jgi:hypothetical protein
MNAWVVGLVALALQRDAARWPFNTDQAWRGGPGGTAATPRFRSLIAGNCGAVIDAISVLTNPTASR